jgi:hypothetical protein
MAMVEITGRAGSRPPALRRFEDPHDPIGMVAKASEALRTHPVYSHGTGPGRCRHPKALLLRLGECEDWLASVQGRSFRLSHAGKGSVDASNRAR